ncbi:MAG: hypothetical protein WA667_22060 [Candidatus Nitrosopolaris sp.]
MSFIASNKSKIRSTKNDQNGMWNAVNAHLLNHLPKAIQIPLIGSLRVDGAFCGLNDLQMTCGTRYKLKKRIAKTRPPRNKKKVDSILLQSVKHLHQLTILMFSKVIRNFMFKEDLEFESNLDN